MNEIWQRQFDNYLFPIRYIEQHWKVWMAVKEINEVCLETAGRESSHHGLPFNIKPKQMSRSEMKWPLVPFRLWPCLLSVLELPFIISSF